MTNKNHWPISWKFHFWFQEQIFTLKSSFPQWRMLFVYLAILLGYLSYHLSTWTQLKTLTTWKFELRKRQVLDLYCFELVAKQETASVQFLSFSGLLLNSLIYLTKYVSLLLFVLTCLYKQIYRFLYLVYFF